MTLTNATNMKKLVSTVAIIAMMGHAGSAMAGCASPAEKVALDTRVLQSDLMVAALTCGQRAEYNQFVKRFKTQLISNGSNLKQYFSRTYGRGGMEQMNQFVTQLANDASRQSFNGRVNEFCAQTHSMFINALALKEQELNEFASRPQFSRHGVVGCNGAQYAKVEK